MNTLRLVSIFGICLFLKVATSFGVEAPIATTTEKITEAPVVTTANGVRVETRTIEKQPSQPVTSNSNGERNFEGSSETKIENNITIDGRGLSFSPVPAIAAAVAPSVALPAAVVAGTVEAASSSRLSITPMAGITAYQGNWNSHIANRGTVGLLIDVPIVSILSLEAEGHYGRFNISYSGYGHYFNQYSGGANAKLTLSRGLIQPYVGVGMMAVYYEGMSYGNTNQGGMQSGGYQGQSPTYNRTIGAGQLVAGADVALFSGVAIGARGEVLRPMTNLPPNYSQGNYAAQGAEDAAAMSTNFYRILGTVRVNF
jgi:opacity protein-like surface antigen